MAFRVLILRLNCFAERMNELIRNMLCFLNQNLLFHNLFFCRGIGRHKHNAVTIPINVPGYNRLNIAGYFRFDGQQMLRKLLSIHNTFKLLFTAVKQFRQ